MFTALTLSLLLVSGAEDNASKAEALFQRARALLKADQAAEACPLLEKSLALDPALGTLMNLADCEERTRRLVAAWLHFNEAAAWADRTKETPRADIARERASELKKRLSWVALSTRAPVSGLTVRVNGFKVELGTTPQSVPVDPGEATVVASADTFRSFTRRVRVAPQQTVALEVPALEPEDPESLKRPSDAPMVAAEDLPLGPLPPQPAAGRQAAPAASTSASASRALSFRPAPVAVMAGGAAALIAGLAGLGWSYSTYGAFQRQQPGGPDAANPTVTRGTFSTLQWMYPAAWVVTAVGALALAGGATWLFLPTGNGAAVTGTF